MRHVQHFDTTPFLAEQRASFEQCGLDWQKSHYVVNRFFDSRNERLSDTSQHWEVVAGVRLAGGVNRILEIGTKRGQFTAFLHSPDSPLEVTRVDLPSDIKRYITATTAARGDVENELSSTQLTVTERSRNVDHLERIRF